MSKLAAIASGNFTDSSKWGTINSTSYLDAETGSEILTTAYSGTRSSSFTPGAITISHIAVKLSVRTGTTGTMSVELAIAGVGVSGTEVTIDVADLPAAVSNDLNGGWVMLKLATPVLLLAATAYTIEAKTSSSNQVSLFRNGTADNISRFLLTTTTAAPAAGDDLVVAGEYVSSGSSNTFTITNNNTATTDFGSAPTAANSLLTPGLAICSKGIFTYGSSSATNYYLKESNSVIVYAGGTLNIGTTGTPIPRDSTAVLEFDPGADGDYGLIARNLSTVSIQGLSRTSGKNVDYCNLNTDEAANSTSLGVDTDTGWLDNDVICVASTTRTASQSEKGTLNGNAGASTLTVDGFAGTAGGLLNAHGGGGTTNVIAEVILLTRNVMIRSSSSTIVAYFFAAVSSVVDIDWAEFYYLGENATGKRGIEIATTGSGSFTMDYCSVHDCEDFGIYNSSVVLTTTTFNHIVCWNLNSAQGANNACITTGLPITVANSTGFVFTNIYILGSSGSGTGGTINLGTVFGTISNIHIAGNTNVSSGPGLTFNCFNAVFSYTAFPDTFNIHSNASYGIGFGTNAANLIRMSGVKCWRNSSEGFLGKSGTHINSFQIDTYTSFGNGTADINSNGSAGNLTFNDSTFDGDASFSTPYLLSNTNSSGLLNVFINNSSIGNVVAHSTGVYNSNSTSTVKMFMQNCLVASPEVFTISSSQPGTSIQSNDHDQSVGSSKVWRSNGTIVSDATTRHTASGVSWKMTPSHALVKLVLPGPYIRDSFKAVVNASSLVTISAWVQKDGSYNGNAPRIVIIGGIIGGISSDVVTSLTVGASTWEQLIVTATPNEAGVVEFYVDCDGTAGNIYVDDISISQA